MYICLNQSNLIHFNLIQSNPFHPQGKLVPRVVNRFRNRRKLSIEVHKVTPLTEVTDTKGNKKQAHSFEECVVR